MQTELKTTQTLTQKPEKRHSARYHSSLAQPLITWPDSAQTVVCVRAPDPRAYRDSKQGVDIETDIKTDINTDTNPAKTPRSPWPWQAVLSTITRWGRGESESRC